MLSTNLVASLSKKAMSVIVTSNCMSPKETECYCVQAPGHHYSKIQVSTNVLSYLGFQHFHQLHVVCEYCSHVDIVN